MLGFTLADPGPFVDVSVAAGVAYQRGDQSTEFDQSRHVACGDGCLGPLMPGVGTTCQHMLHQGAAGVFVDVTVQQVRVRGR